MRYFAITILFLLVQSTSLLAQPYWVVNKSIENQDEFYFGIGHSEISEIASDESAYIHFSKMIEVQVQTTTERFIEENESEISNITINSTKIESDVELRGITITERFYDEESNIFYSLIKYTVSDYEKILKRELNSEIIILKEKNRNEEARKAEEIRHSAEIDKIYEAESQSAMEKEAAEDKLKQQEAERRLEHEKFMLNHYKAFYEKPILPYLITSQNAEVGINNHEFIFKPTIAPFNFIQASYNYYTEYLGFSLGLYWKNNKIEEQDFQIKLRIFKDKFGVYPIALAVGVVQYSRNISNFSDYKKIEWSVSPSVMMNVSFPQIYSTVSFSIDRRRTSFGLQYFPFFEQLNGKISLILQTDYIFMDDYKDRFGKNLIFQPGLRFEVIKNSVSLMISYEDNEFTTITLDFML